MLQFVMLPLGTKCLCFKWSKFKVRSLQICSLIRYIQQMNLIYILQSGSSFITSFIEILSAVWVKFKITLSKDHNSEKQWWLKLSPLMQTIIPSSCTCWCQKMYFCLTFSAVFSTFPHQEMSGEGVIKEILLH